MNSNKNKISTLENDVKTLKTNYTNLQTKNENNEKLITDLQNENSLLKNRINEVDEIILSLKNEINDLKTKIKKEEENKKNIKNNETICKNKFNEKQKKAQTNLMNEIKKKTLNLKIEFLNEIISKELKKNYFNQSLKTHIKNFTIEFLNLNTTFINSFEEETKKILNSYKININNASKNYINFIVIGKAGVGKSTLINEVLKLDKDEKAEEGDNESTTKETKYYSSSKRKMIKMCDTEGLKTGENLDKILNEVDKLIKLKENKNNIILYCTNGDRFEKEEIEYIKNIMSKYPNNDLPVIITVLKYYNTEKWKEKKIKIKDLLIKYLNNAELIEKIKIQFVISRDEDRKNPTKQQGIKELLETAFDMKIKTITSEKRENFKRDVNYFKKEKISKISNEMANFFYNEFQYIKYILSLNKFDFNNVEDSNNIDIQEYKIEDNFKIHLKNKILDIYNFVLNFNDNFEEKNENNNNNEKIANFIEKKLTIIENVLDSYYAHLYQIYYDMTYSLYFINLQKDLIRLNQIYNTKNEIGNLNEIERSFENEFSFHFKNEFYVTLACGIIRLVYDNINEILEQKCNERFNEDFIINQEIYLKKEIEEIKNESLKK